MKIKLPDLKVTNVRLVQGCKIEVTIRNIGSAGVPASYYDLPSPAVSVQMLMDGKPWGGMILKMFDPAGKLKSPGGTAVHIWFPKATNLKLPSGYHTLYVKADNGNVLTEQKENNNTYNVRVKCHLTATVAASQDKPEYIGPSYYKLVFHHGEFLYKKPQQKVYIHLPGGALASDPAKWESCVKDSYQFKWAKWPSLWFMDVRVHLRKVCLYRRPFCRPTGGPCDVNLNFQVKSHPNDPNKVLVWFMQPFLKISYKSKMAWLSAIPSKLPRINSHLWISYPDEWEMCNVGGGSYHLRHKLWTGFFWRVDFLKKKVFKVTGGTFCSPGGSETQVAGVSVKPVY